MSAKPSAKGGGKPASKKPKKQPTPRDLMKLEVAGELGLLQKVQSIGWVGLTAQEAGAIGGVMSHRLRRGDSDASRIEASAGESSTRR